MIQKVGSFIRSCGYGQHLWLVLRYAILNLELIQAAISLAKQEGLLVSLDLASFEMVRKFKLPLMKLLESGNIDLCFSNQDEATELQKWGDCHLDLDLDCTLQHIGVFFHSFDTLHPFRDEYNADPVAAVEFLAKYCKRNVVTLGHNGCIAKHGKEVRKLPQFHGSLVHNAGICSQAIASQYSAYQDLIHEAFLLRFYFI
ncbi:hypothetical protein AHAS_Ahas07G0157300 [Arachis hypogaea]